MIQINLTLFIQIFHFFIAYLIVSNLLLKPTVSVIQTEDEAEKNLKVTENQQMNIISEKENTKNNLWMAATQKFYENKPDIEITETRKPIEWHIPKHLQMTEKVTSDIKKEFTDLVEKKARNVF
jgi:hypothetical protein